MIPRKKISEYRLKEVCNGKSNHVLNIRVRKKEIYMNILIVKK